MPADGNRGDAINPSLGFINESGKEGHNLDQDDDNNFDEDGDNVEFIDTTIAETPNMQNMFLQNVGSDVVASGNNSASIDNVFDSLPNSGKT